LGFIKTPSAAFGNRDKSNPERRIAMSLTVTLNVFSGRPNPVWTVPEGGAAEFMDRIEKISTTSNVQPAGTLGGLGYRGFSVRRGEDTASTYVHAGIIDPGHASPTLIADDREIETWLLSTSGTQLSAEVKAHVEEALKEPVSHAQLILRPPPPHCPHCAAADAPVYNPAIWNTPAVQPHNNCYNYANNQITNTFAQPGRATGHMYTALTCPAVQHAAQSDGLVPHANFNDPLAAGHGWYVALVIWPNVDYHWYRQDKSGCWSHKPGSTAARNVDNAGHAITDPKTCNRGPYINFCTYMITKRTVHIK
jgi:hypothetical protein